MQRILGIKFLFLILHLPKLFKFYLNFKRLFFWIMNEWMNTYQHVGVKIFFLPHNSLLLFQLASLCPRHIPKLFITRNHTLWNLKCLIIVSSWPKNFPLVMSTFGPLIPFISKPSMPLLHRYTHTSMYTCMHTSPPSHHHDPIHIGMQGW